MQSLTQSIYPELAALGGVRVLEGTLDMPHYDMGGMRLVTPEGAAYRVTLTNTGEGILLQGSVTATAVTECARCLEPATLEVEGEAQGYFLLKAEDAEKGYEPDEVDVVTGDGDFDIYGPLIAALSYATPFVVLCRDDCKGLCPKCGANLNEETCDCANAIDPLNPFAALAGLTFSEADIARGEEAAAAHVDDADDAHDSKPIDELSPEEAAALEKALDTFFSDDEAGGSLEFDDDGNLIFIEGPQD